MPKAKEQRSVNLIPLRQTQNDYQILASQNTRAISGLASSSQKHERRLERTTETLAKVSYPLLPYLLRTESCHSIQWTFDASYICFMPL